MRSTRLLVGRLTVGGDEIDVAYADVFVVVREGAEGPGDNDWEVFVTSRSPRRLEPGEHDLVMETREGSTLTGRALVRSPWSSTASPLTRTCSIPTAGSRPRS